MLRKGNKIKLEHEFISDETDFIELTVSFKYFLDLSNNK